MDMNERQAQIEAIGDQLRAKISSKFQTTTFLAGLNFAVLGLQISLLWQPEASQLLPISISLTFIAILLYIGSIIKLDGLTMPKTFWKKYGHCKEDEQRKDRDEMQKAYLNNEDLFELKERMIYYWISLTIVATVITLLSLYLMLMPLPRVRASELTWNTFMFVTITPLPVLIYIGLLYIVAKKRFNHYRI